MIGSSQESVLENFKASSTEKASKPKRKKKPHTTTVSFRVTNEEKAHLEAKAGAQTLGAYARQELLGDVAVKRSKRHQKKPYQPKIDHVEIARLLGTFGQSEWARSIIALSLAAQAGDLEVDVAVENKLDHACDDIHDIKVALIMALGVKPQGS